MVARYICARKRLRLWKCARGSENVPAAGKSVGGGKNVRDYSEDFSGT
jgi:hypothetical protein